MPDEISTPNLRCEIHLEKFPQWKPVLIQSYVIVYTIFSDKCKALATSCISRLLCKFCHYRNDQSQSREFFFFFWTDPSLNVCSDAVVLLVPTEWDFLHSRLEASKLTASRQILSPSWKMLACLSAGRKLQLGMREINVFTPKVMCSLQLLSYTVCVCLSPSVCMCMYLQALRCQGAGAGHISV